MRKINLVLFISLGFSLYCAAQNNKKYQFHSINSIALMTGSNGVAWAVQTVNGLEKGQWFAGLGLGLDYYQYGTVPFFADLRYYISKKKDKVFVYADAGINFPAVQDHFYERPQIWNNNLTNSFKNGFYSDAGIGIRTGLGKGNSFVFSLGYNRKTMQEILVYDDWVSGKPTEQVNKYLFNRIIIKAGLRF